MKKTLYPAKWAKNPQTNLPSKVPDKNQNTRDGSREKLNLDPTTPEMLQWGKLPGGCWTGIALSPGTQTDFAGTGIDGSLTENLQVRIGRVESCTCLQESFFANNPTLLSKQI